MQSFGFTADDAERIAKTVRHVENSPTTGVPQDNFRPSSRRRIQITLDEDLDRTPDYDNPTSVRATVKVGLDGEDGLGSEAGKITVWNRFRIDWLAGDLVHAVEVDEDDRWYVDGGGGEREIVLLCSPLPGRVEESILDASEETNLVLPWVISEAKGNLIALDSSRRWVLNRLSIPISNPWLMAFDSSTLMIVEKMLGVWVPSVSDCSGDSSSDECYPESF